MFVICFMEVFRQPWGFKHPWLVCVPLERMLALADVLITISSTSVTVLDIRSTAPASMHRSDIIWFFFLKNVTTVTSSSIRLSVRTFNRPQLSWNTCYITDSNLVLTILSRTTTSFQRSTRTGWFILVLLLPRNARGPSVRRNRRRWSSRHAPAPS